MIKMVHSKNEFAGKQANTTYWFTKWVLSIDSNINFKDPSYSGVYTSEFSTKNNTLKDWMPAEWSTD